MAVESSTTISLGTPIFPFDLPSVDGKNYSVESFKDVPILVVYFTCNHCPYAKASWALMIDLYNRYRDQGIAIVAINPNDATQYPEDDFDDAIVALLKGEKPAQPQYPSIGCSIKWKHG